MARKKEIPRITGTLRAKAMHLPECIHDAKGMVVLGRRIKSVIYSTDIAVIRNCDADAVLAVYPYTPQQVISQAIISASSIPVFVGVGGGLTNGFRSALISQDAEAQGAYAVVVNEPMSVSNIHLIHRVIDIPIIGTVVDYDRDEIQSRLDAGVKILNVSAAKETAEVVSKIRRHFKNVAIMPTGGPTEETIAQTIKAGANSIVYTPPSIAKIFSEIMADYRLHDDVVDSPESAENEKGDIRDMLRMV